MKTYTLVLIFLSALSVVSLKGGIKMNEKPDIYTINTHSTEEGDHTSRKKETKIRSRTFHGALFDFEETKSFQKKSIATTPKIGDNIVLNIQLGFGLKGVLDSNQEVDLSFEIKKDLPIGKKIDLKPYLLKAHLVEGGLGGCRYQSKEVKEASIWIQSLERKKGQLEEDKEIFMREVADLFEKMKGRQMHGQLDVTFVNPLIDENNKGSYRVITRF